MNKNTTKNVIGIFKIGYKISNMFINALSSLVKLIRIDKMVSPNKGTIKIKVNNNTIKKVKSIALILLRKYLELFKLNIAFDAIIIESNPLLAKKKAIHKNTTFPAAKLVLSNIGYITSSTSLEKLTSIKFVITFNDKLNEVATKKIIVIIGTIDNTK